MKPKAKKGKSPRKSVPKPLVWSVTLEREAIQSISVNVVAPDAGEAKRLADEIVKHNNDLRWHLKGVSEQRVVVEIKKGEAWLFPIGSLFR